MIYLCKHSNRNNNIKGVTVTFDDLDFGTLIISTDSLYCRMLNITNPSLDKRRKRLIFLRELTRMS